MNQAKSAEPKVTIVLPVFNGERFLRDSLQSCLDQSFSDWELIAVDDCSTDSTPDILETFGSRDSRIRVIQNQKNLRLPRSLNIGFEQARGRYFTWTSDDNIYEAGALAAMVAKLEEGFDLVYAGQILIGENGETVGQHEIGPPEELPFRNVVNACFLYRCEVHERLGGYAADRFLVEDYDFWLRANRQFRLGALHDNLYRYRHHAGSLSTTRKPEASMALARLLDESTAMDLAQSNRRLEHRLFVAHLFALANAKSDQRRVMLPLLRDWRGLFGGPHSKWALKLMLTSIPGIRYRLRDAAAGRK